MSKKAILKIVIILLFTLVLVLLSGVLIEIAKRNNIKKNELVETEETFDDKTITQFEILKIFMNSDLEGTGNLLDNADNRLLLTQLYANKDSRVKESNITISGEKFIEKDIFLTKYKDLFGNNYIYKNEMEKYKGKCSEYTDSYDSETDECYFWSLNNIYNINNTYNIKSIKTKNNEKIISGEYNKHLSNNKLKTGKFVVIYTIDNNNEYFKSITIE